MSVQTYLNEPTKDTILFLLSCEYKSNKQVLSLLSDGPDYILRDKIKWLKENGYIKVSKTRPPELKLSKKGQDLIKERTPKQFQFYMFVTNDNQPGGTTSHIEIRNRNIRALTLMQQANVLIASQKPKYEDIVSEKAAMHRNETSFFLSKELRYEDQIRNRVQLSRATGVFFSHGIIAPVYCCADAKTIRLSSTTEKELKSQISGIAKTIYKIDPAPHITDAIIISNNDEEMLSIASQKINRAGKTKYIGDAIEDRTITETNFRYIPYTQLGILLLSIQAKYSERELNEVLFTKEQIQAAENQNFGDAVIKGLTCFQFITGNLTRMSMIKRNVKNLDNIGIVCCDEQADFLIRFFEKPNLHIRKYKAAELKKLITEVR